MESLERMRSKSAEDYTRGLRRPLQYPNKPPYPLQSETMFAARPFPLNTASAAPASVAARAISTKTTTIKG
ncbi:hypothetical protein GT347_23720 [Xylophilus rhododendri]|uniref:Uncharacterized protein n=1 Tax=Xylophilus rhododendri TaxID=2697032 RepID=A0A857J9Q4_9BURK|nr:hypothetical protein [Xylophilus rhododendri]QHJ00725.1 hypothetical protein GT347_23720 [Xylophilus rhododendri]